jgi:hypothetical protein
MSSTGVVAREAFGVTRLEFALEKPKYIGEEEGRLITVGQHKTA